VSDSASSAPKPVAEAKPSAEAKSAPAVKVKPPAPEDKPFATFIPELFLPALTKQILVCGGPLPDLRLVEAPMPVVSTSCWQVIGAFPSGRRFWLCFTAAEINAAKTFSVAESGCEPSLLESFLIDERKTTLALLVSRVVSRLNAQKWLGPN
jgi:hypothetical protein